MKAKKTKSRRGGIEERGSGSKKAVELSVRIGPFSPAKAMKEEARYVEHRLGGALTRVGNTPMERLQWLLDFMRRDLDGLGKGDLLNLHDDFHAFTFRSGVRTSWGDPYKEGFTLEQRKKVQEEIQSIIGAVVSGQTCNYELPAQRIIGRRRKDGRVVVILKGGDLHTQVLSMMEEILKAEGHRLKVCPESQCQRVFAAVKRQAYCSVHCSQSARTRRYFENHSKEELSKKRKARYERSLAKGQRLPSL